MASLSDYTGAGRVRSKLIEISKFGMDYDDLLIKNSQAIGFIEGEMKKRAGASSAASDDLLRYSMAISDTTSHLKGKTLAFFQLDYIAKREKMRDMASSAEIEFVLDNITDDVIIFDDNNRFCKPADLEQNFRKLKGIVSAESELKYENKIKDTYNSTFTKIYNAWGFSTGISAWQYFYQFLIEGHLAFEIIYDDISKPTKIIGFKELDAALLYPVVQKDHEGKIYLEWLQRDEVEGNHRTLTDAQVIYLNYSNYFRTKRVSFVERMLRSFNLLRIMEHSKVIWHVMNAPLRLKTEVPIGTKSIQKAKEDMNEFLSTFKEDISFNNEDGDLLVDGQPKVLFYKNYIVPKNDRGEAIDISALEYPGPDFSNSELLNYFLRKLKLDSKLPFSRWDYNEGGGSYLLGPDNVAREEITYNKFVKRLRVAYQEIIIKPWYIQMCLEEKGLKNDHLFKYAIGVQYVSKNEFQTLKEQEIHEKAADTITKLAELRRDDGSKAFSIDFLIKRYTEFTDSELTENEEMIKKALLKKKMNDAATGTDNSGDETGDEGLGGEDMGGEDMGGEDMGGEDMGGEDMGEV